MMKLSCGTSIYSNAKAVTWACAIERVYNEQSEPTTVAIQVTNLDKIHTYAINSDDF